MVEGDDSSFPGIPCCSIPVPSSPPELSTYRCDRYHTDAHAPGEAFPTIHSQHIFLFEMQVAIFKSHAGVEEFIL